MKILITGINGQVGHALMQHLIDHELIGITRKDCDLTNLDQIKKTIDFHQPDLIINPAAYTKVDQAEDETELAFQINRDAPRVMAEKAREYNIPFIHFSTDYVFDGEKVEAYVETDLTNPIGIYGQSKLAGEEVIQEVGGQNYIFRTSWVYSTIGHNFYLTMKKLSQERDELKVVADQIGVPTSNQFIAEQIKLLIGLANNLFGKFMPRARAIRHQVVSPSIVMMELRDDGFDLLGDKLVRSRNPYLICHDFQLITLRT